MKFTAKLLLLTAVVCGNLLLAADAVSEFSLESNPNGAWSYGTTPSLGGTFSLYTHKIQGAYGVTGLDLWNGAGCVSCSDLPPYVMHNNTASDLRLPPVTGIVIPANMLNLHPGCNGEYTVVRWTVPAAGTYRLQGAFKALDWTTTDVHVLRNSTFSLLAGFVVSQEGQVPFDITQKLSAGDKIDFAVGFGQDNSNGYDSTGFNVVINALGPTYAAAIQPPIESDWSSVFKAKRGTIPVKFTLAMDGASTCQLPPATIILVRTPPDAAPGTINEDDFALTPDDGSSFRITDCQYHYNLASSELGPGTYRVGIVIDSMLVGSAGFSLR